MKSKIYIETSVISYLTSRTSRDLVTAARQQLTTEWWESKRREYALFVSQPVISEASDGDRNAAKKRLSVINKVPLLDVTEEAVELAKFLIEETPFPENATIDALHIAIGCVHEMDFILTWNFKHIANAAIRSKLEVLTHSKEFKLPVICTPEELLS
ncbi:MAG: type II toxin-antitoxin system VapC family toxin [Balneolaceae bacterium]